MSQTKTCDNCHEIKFIKFVQPHKRGVKQGGAERSMEASDDDYYGYFFLYNLLKSFFQSFNLSSAA